MHVLQRVVEWAEREPSVRAVVLTSTRARGDSDELSDYDVIVAATEPDRVAAEVADAYPGALARWGDESVVHGEQTRFRGVVYADGVKIDWTIWPDALLDLVAAEGLSDALDVGYRVLLDKDGRTSSWPAPTYRAHVPARPTEEEYRAIVEEFWWSATYVARALARGEIVFAKLSVEYDVRNALRRMLEWRIELDHDWSLKPGAYGRGLERLLPAGLWDELAATYVGADVEQNWRALFALGELFTSVGVEVGRALGYEYPRETAEGVTTQLRRMRAQPA